MARITVGYAQSKTYNKMTDNTVNQSLATDNTSAPLFSILIPSWNNLPYLKLCVKSIRENSDYRHQIIVHVNESTDGTLQWVKSEGIDYTYSKHNVGVCLAMNMMRTKVKTQYMLYLNDDMYLLPGWDKVMYDEVKRLGTKFFYLSASVIQPHHHPGGCTGWLGDYGDTPGNFQEQRLLKEYASFASSDWRGATRPPVLVHRDVWDLVGGYSIELTPGMGSDPDFTAKLLFVGVKHLKGLAKCRAYHFESKTTAVVRKNKYVPQFLFKWGLLNSSMRRHVTFLGISCDSRVQSERHRLALTAERWRARLKAVFYAIKGDYGALHRLDDGMEW